MSDDKNWKFRFEFTAVVLLILLVLTLFSGCLEKIPKEESGEPNAPIVSKTSIIKPIENQNTITNSIGIEFVLIPAGEFDMGSSRKGPIHKVIIGKVFYFGKYEVTQKQWRDIMGNSLSYFIGDDLPVENVTWYDVQEFIKKLNEKEGTNKYRLPSEAEWEYAARAGTNTRYFFGDDKPKLEDYAWHGRNLESNTHPVGQKKPNPWGLYDIYGNVWEWVQDKWHDNYKGAPTDGSAWESGDDTYRVIRGGGWYDDGIYEPSSDQRKIQYSIDHYSLLGFRLVKDL